MKKIIAPLLLTLGILFLLLGCQQAEQTTQTDTPKQTNGKLITKEEAAKHDTVQDCWLIIDGKVYDVTSYVDSHPGQESILEGCGMDSTELYETRPMGSGTPHSSNARKQLEEYFIGEIE